VYILYLDESGLDTESEYFILSGFALHDKQRNRFQDSMSSVKDNIKNEYGIKGDFEIHGKEVFNRNKCFRNLKTKENGIKSINDVIAAIDIIKTDKHSPYIFFSCIVNKKDKPDNYYEYSFEQICNRFNYFLRTMSAKGSANKGIVMIDENHYQKKLINDLKKYQSIGTQYSNGHTMSNIIEDISFVNSKNSFCMQFSDILTYGMHRFINKNDDSIIRNIIPKFKRIYNDNFQRWGLFAFFVRKSIFL